MKKMDFSHQTEETTGHYFWLICFIDSVSKKNEIESLIKYVIDETDIVPRSLSARYYLTLSKIDILRRAVQIKLLPNSFDRILEEIKDNISNHRPRRGYAGTYIAIVYERSSFIAGLRSKVGFYYINEFYKIQSHLKHTDWMLSEPILYSICSIPTACYGIQENIRRKFEECGTSNHSCIYKLICMLIDGPYGYRKNII